MENRQLAGEIRKLRKRVGSWRGQWGWGEQCSGQAGVFAGWGPSLLANVETHGGLFKNRCSSTDSQYAFFSPPAVDYLGQLVPGLFLFMFTIRPLLQKILDVFTGYGASSSKYRITVPVSEYHTGIRKRPVRLLGKAFIFGSGSTECFSAMNKVGVELC